MAAVGSAGGVVVMVVAMAVRGLGFRGLGLRVER